MHKIKRRDQLAIIKSLWIARDTVAAAQDIAAGKLLNDSAIVELALAAPTSKGSLKNAYVRLVYEPAGWKIFSCG